MRKLVKDFLGREGYQVLEAGDGLEAMEAFYAEKDIALIILDVMMPKMDGWQTCREIRQSSKVPIIMLTARGDELPYLQRYHPLPHAHLHPTHSNVSEVHSLSQQESSD